MGNNIDQIEDRLYLGNVFVAQNKEMLESYHITHIVNISDEDIFFPNDFTYLHIFCYDKESELIILNFPIIAKFITESLLEQKNSVFVHCSAGVSRSATAIISYLMKKEEISYEKAEQMVSSKRRQIAPNVAFVEQLKLWEQLNYRLEGDSEKHLSFKRLQILHKAFRSITPYLDQISSGSILFKIASIIITEASKDEKLISSEQKEKLLGLIEQQDHQFQKVLQKCLESNYFPSFTSIDYKKNKFYSNFIKILAEY